MWQLQPKLLAYDIIEGLIMDERTRSEPTCDPAKS